MLPIRRLSLFSQHRLAYRSYQRRKQVNNEKQFYASIAESMRNGAKLEERLAIMEIVIEELKHASTQEELQALDRVAAQIKHRTTKGL